MIHANCLSAVMSALADTMDNTSKQAWQKLYRPSYPDSLDLAVLMRAGAADFDRVELNSWIFARLHSQLKPRHWDVLTARYSHGQERKAQAIAALAPLIASPAPALFVYKAVTAWAIPALKKGKEGKRSTGLIVLGAPFYDINTWDPGAGSERTRRRWKARIQGALDEMLGEALEEAERILRHEGVLFSVAS